MITVGLVKELYFISSIIKHPILCDIKVGGGYPTLGITVSPNGMLDVMYQGQQIWHESIEGEVSFFGIESCDTISRIIACINNGTDWSQYRWAESP